MKINLTEENFLLYAVKHYKNPSCGSMKEFRDDLKRFKYIKRLLRKYEKSGNISDRLILNHLILLHNVFGDDVVPLLFFKIEQQHWNALKTFLVYLDYLEDGYQITSTINESEIHLDSKIINILRKI